MQTLETRTPISRLQLVASAHARVCFVSPASFGCRSLPMKNWSHIRKVSAIMEPDGTLSGEAFTKGATQAKFNLMSSTLGFTSSSNWVSFPPCQSALVSTCTTGRGRPAFSSNANALTCSSFHGTFPAPERSFVALAVTYLLKTQAPVKPKQKLYEFLNTG